MGGKVRVALDVCVPRQSQDLLWRAGFEVVVWARPGEADRSWFNRAIQGKARFIVTQDVEVLNWCHNHGIKGVGLPQKVRGSELSKTVIRRLNHALYSSKPLDTSPLEE